ncbi:MAG TPA: alpha/beta hydrolase [Ktedonobacteraceae bacterium]|nr:alpha/beta hydrolase [Ktedonobacteraceae bacterium]
MSQANASPEIGQSIQAGGVMTNYHEAGSGSPVILIHGSGPGVSAWANWQFAIPFLAQRLRVFAYDQLGFGYSEAAPNQSYSLKRWTDHLLNFMQAVGVRRAHLVGNSMGAAVALAAAVTQPEAVDRLVLMGAMGVRFNLKRGEGLDAVWGYTPSVENMRRLIDLFAYNPGRFPTEQLAKLRYEASIRPGAQEAFSSMFPEPRQKQVEALAAYEDHLSDVQNPTLIIHGREDRVIPIETSLKLINTLPNAQLHVFGHCGHWTQLEPRDTFNRLVRDFLTEETSG